MVSLQVYLFGKLQIFDHTQSLITLPLKAQELFVYLFVYNKSAHERETLSTKLWPDIPENRSKKYLRQALWQLQTSLQDEKAQVPIIQLDGSWVQLDIKNNVWIDAEQMYQTFFQVRDAPTQDITAEQARWMTEAVRLYQGELVTGWYQDWCLLERERYQSIFLAMLDKLIDYCLWHQQFDQGVEFAMHVLRYHQARERSHRRLMRLYYLADNRTAALRQYKLCADALERELNVKPSQKTDALYQQIRADYSRDLPPLSSPVDSFVNRKAETDTQFLTLLQSIQTNVLSMQQEIKSLKQTLSYLKDVSTDS